QGVGQFRELVVDLQVDAGGEQGERLQQPLDVRVGAAAVALQPEPAGLPRVLLGELRSQLADEPQFPVVVLPQHPAHASPRRTWWWPWVSSSTVSNVTAGAGSRFRRASMWKYRTAFLASSGRTGGISAGVRAV